MVVGMLINDVTPYPSANTNDVIKGQSGLGKSTLVNTIFASHLIDSKGRLNSDEPPRQTTEIENVSHGKLK